nr:MAG TPA: hypothetical protein [Bacteriophage sp.]
MKLLHVLYLFLSLSHEKLIYHSSLLVYRNLCRIKECLFCYFKRLLISSLFIYKRNKITVFIINTSKAREIFTLIFVIKICYNFFWLQIHVYSFFDRIIFTHSVLYKLVKYIVRERYANLLFTIYHFSRYSWEVLFRSTFFIINTRQFNTI